MTDIYDLLLDKQDEQPQAAGVVEKTQSAADPYDKLLDDAQAAQMQASQQSLDQALKVLPQNAADTLQLSKATGLPQDVVERNKDKVQQQVKLKELQTLLATSPILARQMQDPTFAKLAHTDADTLSTLERLWRQPAGGAVQGIGMGTAGIGNVLDIFQRNLSKGFARTFLPEPIGGWDKVDNASLAGPMLGEDLTAVGTSIKQAGIDLQIPQLQQTFFDQVLAGLGQVAGQVAVGALTGPVGSGAFLFGQGANAMTDKVAGDNASQEAKDLAVLGGAGVTAITEKWALDKMLGPLAVPIQNQVGAALARIGVAAASEGVQETIESIAQDAIRQVLTNPDAPIQFAQAIEEGGVGATVGAIVRTMVEAAAGVRSRGVQDAQRIDKSEQQTAMIEKVNELAANSELLKTNPEAFQQFIEAAAEDSDVRDVYIDAKFLMQSGIADQLAQLSPSVAQQLPTALATGGTVQIPVGEYAAKIAPTEFAQGLIDHIKTDPLGFTRAEVQDYYQNQAQDLETEIAQQFEAKQVDQEFVDSKERLKQTILNELNTLGRFTPQKNEVDATLIAARSAVRAAQLGMTPEAFFEQQRLRFAAERIDGDTFSQDGQLQTDTPAFKNWFGDSKVVDDQGKPWVVYHGTNSAGFDTFNRAKGKSITDSETGFYFSSDPENASGYAERGRATKGGGKAVYPVYLAIKNPLVLDFKNVKFANWSQFVLESPSHDFDIVTRKATEISDDEKLKRQSVPTVTRQIAEAKVIQDNFGRRPSAEIMEREVSRIMERGLTLDSNNIASLAKAGGFDGVILRNIADSAKKSAKPQDTYIALTPTQIKSAVGNRGTFDPNDPNILFQGGREPLPDSMGLWGYLNSKQGLSVNKLVDVMRQYKDAAPEMAIAADGEYGPFGKDIIDQIPNAQLVFASGEDKGFAVDADGYAYTIFKGRVIDHKQKSADEARGMARNLLKAKIADMRNNDPVEAQRRQEQERRQAIEDARTKRIENAPKLSGDFQVDLKTLAEYAENFQEFRRLLTADMLDVSDRNRTRLARAVIALEPDAVTAANVMDKEPALIDDYLKFGTPAERAVASMLNSKAKTVTMYRGMPADQKIEAGDWVSFSKAYAKGHESNVQGTKASTKQKTVSKSDVYWYGADVNEWVYVPSGTFGNVGTLRELWDSLGQSNKPDGYTDTYNQFAGELSRMADLGQLAVARGMAERGYSAVVIQQQTGWIKGTDGQWRYEISDDQAKFVTNDVDAEAVAAEAQQYISAQLVGNQYKATYDNGDYRQWLSTFGWTEDEARANLIRKLVDRNGGDGFDINKARLEYPYTVGEVLDHPELFAAYPDIANINLKFTQPEGDNVGGVYFEKRNLIEITMGDQRDMLSVLLHEIQHAIQARENFARGGSSDKTFTDSVRAAVARMQENKEAEAQDWKDSNLYKLLAAKNAGEMARNAMMYQSAQRLIDYANRDKPSGVFRLIRNESQWIYHEQFYGNREAKAVQLMFYDIPKRGDKRNMHLRKLAWEAAQFLLNSIPEQQLQVFKQDTRAIQSMVKALGREVDRARKELTPMRELDAEAAKARELNEKTKYKTPYQIYEALAGEIEARTTQARQALTPGQRRDRPVYLDMDVPAEQAIVIIGGRELRVPDVMRSQRPQGPRGAYNPSTNTIALMKGADLSTFLHEAGHYFFESDIALAYQIAQINSTFGVDNMTQGEREILADVSTLLTWHGINGDINEQLAQWYSMSFEEKRAYHEKTAESFERYLFEGKAPSIELQSYFQQFRAWLTNVYRSIKSFIENNPAAGELTDEVRAVFDRMLATTEEIQLAQQAQSMLPMFRTQADADNIGMTPDEFRAYQLRDVQATNDAVQDMQARALRDLQWTRNAHNREVKRLQKEAAELRSAARMEARASVLSEPVYRAWQFLTRKLTDDDKITPITRPKSDPNEVDPAIDSMFTAIAKLGGLNKAEVVATWGVEESEKPSSGVFGKPVLRATGGRSIDAMVEVLAEYGYLPRDENGKGDVGDFETAFDEELRGNATYSYAYDYNIDDALALRPGEQVNIQALSAGRFDSGAIAEMGLDKDQVALLKARRMIAKDGLHPDLVAELPGIDMTSGEELVMKLLDATPLKEEIEARTEAIMLERHAELASPEAIARTADIAIHNEARAKMVATEANALAKATGERKILAKAAKGLAEVMVSRVRIRDVKPTQYVSAEARAAKAAEKALKSGDLRVAAAEKRSQLVNTYAAAAAYKVQNEIDEGVRYLRKFEKDSSRKGLDVDYIEQIDTLLERFDLRKGQSLKSIDKRTNLAAWVASQEQAGLEPSIPEYILAEANRTHYKNLTVEQFRGLVESVKQIEHLGRLKKKLLTAKDNRELDAIVDEIRDSMKAASGGATVDNEKRQTVGSKLEFFGRWINAAHRKAASVVRQLDGYQDGGPMWSYFMRTMNEAGDKEAVMRAEASQRLHNIVKPVIDGETMGGKGRWFPSLNRSLNRGERLAIALNWGNASNRQRLMGGRGWTEAQLSPVLASLTSAEWKVVQDVWDFFESYRPEIAAKEMRVYGKEPDWIEPAPFEITTADGTQMQIRGGYYPVKYDPNQSGKAGEFAEAEEAKALMRAAYTAATTRRSFTKGRAEEVQGRPLLLTFDGIWQGANEVIHDLSWHEWLIDANRLLKRLDGDIRNGFGAEYVDVLRKAVKDSARGDVPAANMVEKSLTHIRNGSTIVGMGWNITTALMQPLGYANSVVRIGGTWLARGMSEFFGSPQHMISKAEEVQAKSAMMRTRMLTMNREINDVRNRLESDRSELRERIESSYFIMIQKLQASVDYPTWLGAYAKAISDPSNDEARAIALADQAVLDAQGGGQIKDLAEVQRGHPVMKIFTNFYSYFNVLYNLAFEQTRKRVQSKEYGGLMSDYLMLMVVPAVMSAIIRNAVKGEDDEDEYAKAIAAELVGYPFGMFIGVRELAGAMQLASGVGNPGLGYSGPAGLRFFSEMNKLGQQVGQGETDLALFKSANNVAGLLFHYPAGQVNRMVEGTAALIDGETDNPLAPLVGVQR